jgi:hypothetical protein
MNTLSSTDRNVILAAGLGAIFGGVAVLLGTKAIPNMVTQMQRGMMQHMMGMMKERGCSPPEM